MFHFSTSKYVCHCVDSCFDIEANVNRKSIAANDCSQFFSHQMTLSKHTSHLEIHKSTKYVTV